MGDGYDSFDLVWCERDIEVRYQANWLNTDHCHIELHCAERLPVTETGYRSHFVPGDAVTDEDDVRRYILAWLDEVARDPSWARHLEDSKQLNLF
ncbi:hypothetical protein ROG8370_00257 [Roseovarius gaetbuli]|uniref:Uncharacterized protein n=1 Tax=Roseovarius gaetbuli TaxID=1356575 RepID=A0A1X6Y7D5_9RHOB|nr:hypothetical protein [Roseovarius gaetbuli]SLN12583.1 hypothetical protein ROG8370_00257 [Roseovarius gaetbuli]